MTSIRSRLLAGVLAAVLALGAPLTALADELPSTPADPGGESGSSADLLDITVPDYTPGQGLQAGNVNEVRKGELYTLIVLPSSAAADGSTPKPLDASLLTTADPLFIGSAIASDNGKVTFTNIRLRTAQAAVYYVTGPGLEGAPLVETTGLSVALSGNITYTPLNQTYGVENATVSLVDETTGYAYANSVTTGSAGFFTLDDLSPGRYFLHVEKPGYIPATRETVTIIDDDRTTMIDFDISSYLGDVNGDGVRNMSDLTDLLFCYGKNMNTLPDGFTPDLFEDNSVNAVDATLLVNAMIQYDNFPRAADTPSAGQITLAARDVTAAAQTDRTLRFSLSNAGTTPFTFTAANLSLTFRTDYIQPINQNGGVIHPGNAGASTGCLVPKTGVTVSDARWSVTGDLATLTFSLSCARPTSLTDLVDFRYRPAPGKSVSDFFKGVFSVDHAAALVGQTTVLTDCGLEYPNSSPLELDSITINLADSTFTIPSSGHILTLALTATGADGETVYPNLSGLTWTLSRDGGGSVEGVSISDSLLTITDQATPGDIQLTASRDGVPSQPVTLTLENARPVPQSIRILRGGSNAGDHTLTADAYASHSFSYAAQVIDQYGLPMELEDQTVAWSLSGAPAQVSVDESGTLTVGQTLPAGTYSFSLLASLDGLRTAVNITLTLETQLDHLVLSGPADAQIPSGAGTVTLSYVLSAFDAQDHIVPPPSLGLTFMVLPLEGGGETVPGIYSDVDMSDNLTVTINSDAQPGEYTLRVTGDGVSADFTLTLQPPDEAATSPTRVALSYQDALVTSLDFTFISHSNNADDWTNIPFGLLRLDQNGNRLSASDPNQSWRLSTSDPSSLNGTVAEERPYTGLLTFVSHTPGTQFYTLTALEEVSGLSITIPVTATFLPQLASLTLSAPDSLSIPTSGPLEYPLGVTALDSDGASIPLPDGLRWSVTDADGSAPSGVSLQAGVLTISPSAKPGPLTLSVWPQDTSVKDPLVTKTITLTSAGTEAVLSLLREGDLFSGGVDSIYGKEGTALSLSYTPILRDPITGDIQELAPEDVTWVGLRGTFTVDSKAEPGVYTAPITALHNGQSVSLTAQITVYPDITGLYIDFEEGDTAPADESYSFPIPSQGARTYHGVMMAKLNRNGTTQKVPLAQLGLSDYEIDLYTYLTGVYLSYDKATGQVALTIEPLASDNPMQAPEEDDLDIRFLGIDFSYYPGQKLMELELPCFLTKESPVLSSAILRQGSGAGSKFVFETTRGETSIDAAAGVLSDCFAIELLDQYGNPVLNQYVNWDLTGSPTDARGNDLITRIDPGKAVTDAYPRYQSIRRLRIAPETPAGTYRLTLTAGVGATESQAKNNPAFTRSIDILLTVTSQQSLSTLTVTGPASAVIPRWYSMYNSSTVNNNTLSLSYVAVARDPNDNELDASLCDFSWKVTTQDGGAVSGITVASDRDNPAAATVTVDRHAEPTAKDVPLLVTATATPKGGGEPLSSHTGLALTQGNLVPTLMTISGTSSVKLELDSPNTTRDYTFKLVNQYDDPVSSLDAKSVKWTLDAKNASAYVTMSEITDSSHYPAARLHITNPKRDVRLSVTLTASITFPEASTSSGEARVYRNLPITITVGNPPTGGGDIGGGELEVTQSTVTPSTSKSGTTGTSTLSQSEIDILTKTTASGVLTIEPKNTSGLTSITVTFPGSLAKAIAAKTQNQSLRIRTAIGTVTIPKNVLSDFSGSGNISVTILNQTNKVAVTFRRGSSNLTAFTAGRTVTFSAPVKAKAVTAVSGGVSGDVVKRNPISNGTLTVSLTGSAELTLGGEAEVTQSTVTPSTNKSGTTGTSTLSQSDIDILTQTTASGTITIAPTNTSGLTSITVTFPGSVPKAITAKTQNQSLRIQTAIGTVTIPKNVLSDFSGSGNVSVTILNQNNKLAVTFRRAGSDLTAFTAGRTVTFSAPVTAQTVTAVSGGVSSDVLSKSVISNGTLTVALTGSAELTLGVRGKVFSDTVNHWAKSAVDFVVERGLFQGTSETTFSPNGNMTRGMVVTVLHRLENTPAASAANVFRDVPNGVWYTDAVVWANSNGIVQGTGSGFLPNDPVTREQLVTILFRYMKAQGHSTDRRDQLSAFSDRDHVSPWAREAMEWAVAAGLITGKSGGVLDPGGQATRAEVATMLERLVRSLTPSV